MAVYIFDRLIMVIKLYIDYASQPSRSVLALCLAASIPHEIVEISILKKEVPVS